MSSVIDRLRKRSCRPVDVNGEKFYVRGLTSAEIRQADEVGKANADESNVPDANLRAEFILGTTLVDADGSRVLPRGSDETVDAFARRVRDELADVEEEIKIVLLTELGKASKVPSPETLAKN